MGQFLSSGVARGTIKRVTDNYSDGKRGRKELLYSYTKTFRGSKVHDLGIFQSTTKWCSTQLVSNFHMLKICWKLHEHTNKSIQKVLCFKKFIAVKNFSQIWQRKINFLKILGVQKFRPFSKSLLLLSSGGGGRDNPRSMKWPWPRDPVDSWVPHWEWFQAIERLYHVEIWHWFGMLNFWPRIPARIFLYQEFTRWIIAFTGVETGGALAIIVI